VAFSVEGMVYMPELQLVSHVGRNDSALVAKLFQRPDSTSEMQHLDVVAAGRKACAVADEWIAPGCDLAAGADGNGGLHARMRHHLDCAVPLLKSAEAVDNLAETGIDERDGLRQPERQPRVDHVLAGGAKMKMRALRLSKPRTKLFEQGRDNHPVIADPFGKSLDIGRKPGKRCLDFRHRSLGDNAMLGLRTRQCKFKAQQRFDLGFCRKKLRRFFIADQFSEEGMIYCGSAHGVLAKAFPAKVRSGFA